MSTTTPEDEVTLKVGFKLLPSRTVFSRITAYLYFDEMKIDSLRLRVLQGALATEESEFSSVLAMVGIEEGQHTLRVEMCELWSPGEKSTSTSKEVIVEYHPVKREDRLIRVPIIKSTAGADVVIVTDTEKNIFRETQKDLKQEAESRRDHW